MSVNCPHWAVLALLPLAACSSDDGGSSAANLFDGYANSSISVPTRLEIASVAPLNPSAAIIGFTVSPALPDGLSLDDNTGVISGTPSGIAAATVYTVTAANGSDSDSETITIEVRTPIVGLSSDVPLTRNANGAGSPLAASGAGVGLTGTPPVAGTALPTEIDTPTDATVDLIAASDTSAESMDAVPSTSDLTTGSPATITIDDTELSTDPWTFAAQAPYDDDGLTPDLPSFTFDTSTVPLEDGDLTLDVDLAGASFPAFDSGSLPTSVGTVVPLTTSRTVLDDDWTELNGAYYFEASTESTGHGEIHRYDPDGGLGGTPSFELAIDLDPTIDGDASVTAVIGDQLIVRMFNDESTPRRKFYAYDTIANELVQIADLRPGDNDTNDNFVEVDGDLYFAGDDATDSESVYRYTFAEGGTPASLDRVSSTSGATNDDRPSQLQNIGGVLYFIADDDMGNRHLYRFDPATSTQERLSADSNAPVTSIFAVGSELYALAANAMGGEKLHVWDETGGNLIQILDIEGDPTVDDLASFELGFQGDLYFLAQASTGFQKIFRYRPNTVPAVVEQVSDTAGSSADDNTGELFAVGDTLYYSADNSNGFNKFWAYDPATGETRQVFDINGSGAPDAPNGFLLLGTDRIAMAAIATSGGQELFIHNIATGQTVRAADTDAGDDNVFTAVDDNGRVIFTAADSGGDVAAFAIE